MSERLSLRQQLLQIGFQRCDPPITFADGQTANNKLELSYDAVRQHDDVYQRVIVGLFQLARPYKPDFIVGIPNGATEYALQVAIMLDVHQIMLDKDDDTKALSYASTIDYQKVQGLQRGILVEDVINRRSSLERAMRLPDMAAKIVGVIGVFDRGLMAERRSLNVPVQCIATMPIPAQLSTEFNPVSLYDS
jgi:orotate phosphoribosyltransferase